MPRAPLVLLIVLGLGTAACGGSSGSTQSFAVTVSQPSAGKVAITAPSSVKAGKVEMTLKNTGNAGHDAQLIRVDGNHSVDEILSFIQSEGGPIPSWLHGEGGVSTVAPGQSQTATMVLSPGQHYIVDTDSDDNNNAFAQQGGVQGFTVTGSASGASVGSADATITAHEYEFGIPKNLKAGTSTVKFENTGKELHLLVAVPILPGKTIDDVKQAFQSEDQNTPPPVDFEKATGFEVIDPGRAVVSKLTLQKGSYAFICFVNDRAGGPPHLTKGMLQQVNVG